MVVTMNKADEPFLRSTSYTILCTASSYYYYIYILLSLSLSTSNASNARSALLFCAFLCFARKGFQVLSRLSALLCPALLCFALLC